MPRFFFNLRSQGDVSIDEIGTEFSCLEAAYLDACDAILQIAFDKLRSRQDPSRDTFEIADRERKVLMQVPFVEVLQPRAAKNIARMRLDTLRILDNCLHQVARSEALQVAISAELEQAKKTCSGIRANLARIPSCSS
jgi:hypothetical protein